jgi:hypothetical protein
MTHLAGQSLAAAVGGGALFLVVFGLSRRGLLSLRYALGWMAVCVLLLAATVVLAIAGGISDSLPLTPTGLIAAVGLGFLTLVALQLSISLSGHQEAIRELSETNALLEERLARVEERERDGGRG